jgi:hypothetical protein
MFSCKNIAAPAGVTILHMFDASFAAAPLLKLTHLRVRECANFKMEDLKDCPNLESVRLDWRIKDIASLQRFSHLRSLRLGSPGLLTKISGLEALTQLTFLDINMDRVEVWQIERLTELRSLVLREWQRCYGVLWLRKFTRLEVLRIVKPRDDFKLLTWELFEFRFRLIQD